MVLTVDGAYRAITGNKETPGWVNDVEQIEVSAMDRSVLIVTAEERPTGKSWQVSDGNNWNMYTFVRSAGTSTNFILYKCIGYCEGTEIKTVVFMLPNNKNE